MLTLTLPKQKESNTQSYKWLGTQLYTYPKIKIFLWLCSHDKINNNYNLFRKNIRYNPFFLSCSKEESTSHILRDCDIAKKFWFF